MFFTETSPWRGPPANHERVAESDGPGRSPVEGMKRKWWWSPVRSKTRCTMPGPGMRRRELPLLFASARVEEDAQPSAVQKAEPPQIDDQVGLAGAFALHDGGELADR